MPAGITSSGGVATVPPGSDKKMLSRAFVEEYKRRRVVAAVAELAHEFGIRGVAATGLCHLAKIGRAGFYDLFSSVPDCLEYAFAEAFKRVFDPVREAAEGSKPWLDRLDAAVEALFAAIAAEPLLAELSLVHSVTSPKEAKGAGYQAGVDTMMEIIKGGRVAGRTALGADYQDPPPSVEEFLASAIVSLTASRVRQGAIAALPGHRAEMVLLVANAFFGIEEAARLWQELEAAG